jgi:hypothetical protein
LIVALCSPATTWAAASDLRGDTVPEAQRGTNPFRVGFVYDDRTVKDFTFKNMRIMCDQGRVLLKAQLANMSVTERRFDRTHPADSGDGTIRAKGRFNRSFKRAAGRIAVTSLDVALSDGGTATNCNGEKRWEVARN